jgi:ureidoacrylate peracid hydrolase
MASTTPPTGVQPLVDLREKIDPAWTAVVVIDYQNDFVASRGAFARTGSDPAPLQSIAPALRSLLQRARGARVPIVFVWNEYTYDTNWYLSDVTLGQARRRWKGRYLEVPVCKRGSWGAQLYGGLRPAAGDAVVVKHRFNAWLDTDLALILRSRRIRSLVVAGVLTNVCVESTVREAFFRDYYVVVPQECVATYDKAQHDAALANIDLFFGQVVTLEEVDQTWRGHAGRSPAARRAR